MAPHHFHGPPGGIPGSHVDAFVFLLPGLLAALLLAYLLLHLVATTESQSDHRALWDRAVRRYATTAQAFTAYECDPLEVLRRPALADVTRPATARFVDAFTRSCALLTERYPGPAAGAEFARATEHAERAWAAAVEAAHRDRGTARAGARRRPRTRRRARR